MNPDTRRGGNGNGNGNGAGGFGDFDDFIRDRDDDFSGGASDPFDPYADYRREPGDSGARSAAGEHSAHRPGIDRTIVEAIVRVVDGLAGVAGEALSPELRKQVERTLRDLLVVLRDLITALIERIDNRHDNDLRVEEIPID